MKNSLLLSLVIHIASGVAALLSGAATSLFLGQQDDVFPFMVGAPVLSISSLTMLDFLAYWLVKVRSKHDPQAGARTSSASTKLA